MVAFISILLLAMLPDARASSQLSVISSDAEPLAHDPVLLQAADTEIEAHRLRPPNPPEWFGDFSAAESTYDYDGKLGGRNVNAQINVLDGWNPQGADPLYNRAVQPAWFQETGSAGWKEPWQTFYPADDSSVSGDHVDTGVWFTGKGGTTQQEYRKAADMGTEIFGDFDRNKGLPASWFDNSVRQLDGFGRKKYPGLDSPRFAWFWEERTSNTSMQCDKPGCTSSVSLQAPFDPTTENAKDCKLKVFFRPTDFDDWYRGENVQYVKVNGQPVKILCHPYRDGCNQTAQRPLLPCTNELPMNLLMTETGQLNIEAKIPDYVDECPYEGNYLSAVPMVTCLVAPKIPEVSAPESPLSCEMKMPIRCRDKGCASEIAIPVRPHCQQNPCALNVTFQQTDFDNQDGTAEFIEYITLHGNETLGTDVNPGKNPCKSEWQGTPLSEEELTYKAITNKPVEVINNVVRLEAKITKFVDECASHGKFLLDGMATVKCAAGLPAASSVLQTDKKIVKRKRRHLRGHS
jgi:hypothetical protein